MHPLPNRRATVGAVLHPLRADAAHALMAARHGEVRLRMSHAHDARRLAANGGLRNVVAASDVAGIGERQHRLSRRRRRATAPPHAAPTTLATPTTGHAAPAAPAPPSAARSAAVGR
eukprot:scaffold42639_cov73-Phaeocystis_antarctica.AAC.1